MYLQIKITVWLAMPGSGWLWKEKWFSIYKSPSFPLDIWLEANCFGLCLYKFLLCLCVCNHIIFIWLFQFFLELMKVPRVESKLRVFAFKIQFQSQVWWCLLYFLCLVDLYFPSVIIFSTLRRLRNLGRV